MRYGTSYFPTKEDVIKYYKPLGFSAAQSLDKIKSAVGRPTRPLLPRLEFPTRSLSLNGSVTLPAAMCQLVCRDARKCVRPVFR